jgi:hypothetical protein
VKPGIVDRAWIAVGVLALMASAFVAGVLVGKVLL